MSEIITGYGLSAKYDYYEFELDSLDYSSPQAAGITALNWPTFEVGGTQPLSNVVALKVIQAEIPFTYYVFTSTNGTFVLDEIAGGGPVNVTIAPGNYTISEMLVELKTKLDAASPNTHTYTVTYDDKIQKITIVSSDAGGFSLTFGSVTSTDNGSTNPRLYLGFPGGVTSSTADTLVAPNAVLLSGPNYLYINSVRHGQLTNNLLPRGAARRGNQSYQLCRVPVNAGPGGVILYNDPNPEYWFNIGNSPTFSAIDLFFTLGNTSTLVDFNGLSFSVKLGVLVLKRTTTENRGGGVGGNGTGSFTAPTGV